MVHWPVILQQFEMEPKENDTLLEGKIPSKEGPGGAGSYTTHVKGTIVMCVNAFLIGLSGICVQGLERRIPDFELNAIRFAGAWIVAVFISGILKVRPVVSIKEAPWVGLYSFTGVSCTSVYYIAVTFISLSTEETIYHTTQLFGGLVIFWILLGERPTVEKVVAVILCAIGILFVVQQNEI